MKPKEIFLKKVKELLKDRRYIFKGERIKNRDTLALLGWKPQHVIDFIVNELTPSDVLRGPIEIGDSKLPPGSAYEFLKTLETEIDGSMSKVELFIRIELTDVTDDDEQVVVIISFHVSEK